MADEKGIIVYGTKWCPDCIRAKRVFQKKNTPFTWIDIEEDPEACTLVEKINKGCKSVPTILFPDGTTLVEPDDPVLEKKLTDAEYT
jgi:mycoredoxin